METGTSEDLTFPGAATFPPTAALPGAVTGGRARERSLGGGTSGILQTSVTGLGWARGAAGLPRALESRLPHRQSKGPQEARPEPACSGKAASLALEQARLKD